MTNRELDALFAEKVLRLEIRDVPCGETETYQGYWDDSFPDGCPRFCPVPMFTTSLDAAWQADQYGFLIDLLTFASSDGMQAKHTVMAYYGDDVDAPFGECQDDNPARAIVIACLRAVGVGVDGES